MSKDDDDEEEEEEAECFYESLDRILSSSNSSTCNSEDDCDVVFNTSPPSYHDYHLSTNHHSSSVSCGSKSTPSVSKFSMCVQNYDVWISESFSSSVEQRRDRLLRALGLASDPTLSRRKPAVSDNADGLRFDSNRSVSFDHLNCGDRKARIEKRMCSSNVLRSKSDGSTECESEVRHDGSICDQSNSSFSTSSSILSIRSVSNTVNSDSNKNNHNNVDSIVGVDNLVNNGALGSMSCLNKPSSGKSHRRVDEIQCQSRNLSGKLCSDTVTDGNGGDDPGEIVECNGIEKASDKMCTIKNLDNGKEFVVNEVRDDGMWDKLKEVETGRQLTMEEFQMCVGHSPIVQELMRRQNVEGRNKDGSDLHTNGNGENGSKLKKKVSWLKSIKSVASSVTGHKERRSSDERDTSSEKGGQRSSSATDDSQDVSFHGPERVRVRHYGKSIKELTAFYKSHAIQGHSGSIWTIKFSLDGKYLASAGEDCVIHVWQVVETEPKGELLIERSDDMGLTLFLTDGSPEPTSVSPRAENPLERKRRGRTSTSRKSMSLDYIVVPDTIFGLSEKPFCSFQGHIDDVLDLSWSESQLLLSSSMDKTVRLWNLSIKTCLKVFSHSDYVTCIQFNPVDDRYFISGSLDCKVRIWSIPDRRVVDWNDLHEMVTAACYTPDGQGALVGSYKGSCRLYNTSENKLQQKCQINLQNKKKKSHLKKITGFQFAPGSSSEVLITSADSRVRVVDGLDLVHKFKGFRNTNSQISASVTANGKYVVCASEDSHVYVWKHEGESRPSRSKGVTVTRSYEYFHCQDVAVSIPWPGINGSWGLPDASAGEQNGARHQLDEVSTANHPPTPVEEFNGNGGSPSARSFGNGTLRGTIASATNNYFFDRIAATWPEEKLLMATKNRSPRVSLDLSNGVMNNRSAWGLVIVTAGLRGEIRTFQNFGLPFRI